MAAKKRPSPKAKRSARPAAKKSARPRRKLYGAALMAWTKAKAKRVIARVQKKRRKSERKVRRLITEKKLSPSAVMAELKRIAAKPASEPATTKTTKRKRKGTAMARKRKAASKPKTTKRRRTTRKARARRQKHWRALAPIKRHKQIRGKIYLNPFMPGAIVANPGGVVGSIKGLLAPVATGAAAGALAGVIDAKLLQNRPYIRAGLKLAIGVGGAMLISKKSAPAAAAFAGAMVGSIGHTLAYRALGGVVANNGVNALADVAELAGDDPELAALVADGDDVGDVGDATDYAELADLVEQ